MSRKTNNLRTRLRIEQQRRDRTAEQLRRQVDVERAKLETFNRNLSFPKSVMVRVEESWDRGMRSFDRYVCSVTFSPDSYARTRFFQPGAEVFNASALAGMIGEEIGEKVRAVIFEKLTGQPERMAYAR